MNIDIKKINNTLNEAEKVMTNVSESMSGTAERMETWFNKVQELERQINILDSNKKILGQEITKLRSDMTVKSDIIDQMARMKEELEDL